MDGIFAYGVATDGAHVVISRVKSGAPTVDKSFKFGEPCPTREMKPIPLFGA